MYTYLLNNGEEYSDYRILGIVQSEQEIDWKAIRSEFAQRLNNRNLTYELPDGTTRPQWYIDSDTFDEIAQEVGLIFVAHEELSFDPRRHYGGGAWEVVGE